MVLYYLYYDNSKYISSIKNFLFKNLAIEVSEEKSESLKFYAKDIRRHKLF